MTQAKPDTAAAIEFLKRWAPEGPWHLSAARSDQKAIETRTFYPGDENAYRWIESFNGERNLYFHVNPATRDINKKASREDIKEVQWLHIDIDPRAGEDIEEERARALRLLTNPPEGVPVPTVIIFSGGGYQGFWKLSEPIPINGSMERAEDAKRYNQQLELIYGGDKCHNIDRLMRLPGTINIPNARKQKQGRKPTTATLVEFDEDRVYELSRFKQAAQVQVYDDLGSFSGPTSGTQVKVSGNVKFLDSVDELDEWGVPDRVKVLIVQGRVPDEGPKEDDDSRSAWLFDCVCQLVRAEVPDEVIYAVITDPDNGIAESVVDKGSSMEKYALKQIASAKEFAVDPALKELNSRHAVIGNMGGKCRIIEEVMDHALNRTRVTRQSFEDFRNRYMHRGVMVADDPQKGPSYMPMGKWWLLHPKRRQYETIVFAPNKEVRDAYNLWKGFACAAIPGKCDLFLQHIRDNICQGNEEYYNYTIGWMARAVQKPDSPGETAIVMRGRMGTGKSFFVKMFGSLWGRHFLQVSDPKHLVGSFNAHLRDCVVLFGDEAFYAGDKKHESILKTLVTEETIMIEGKGVDAEAAPNFVHLLLASNSQWVVPAGADDRRYFVLDVGDGQMQKPGYFKAIAEQMDNGGREALLNFLMNYDLEQFDVRRVPKTSALQDQKLLSLTPEQEWWYNKLNEGRVLQDHDVWQPEIMKDALLDDYVEYMKRIGVQRRASATALGKFLSTACPGIYPRSYQKMTTVDVPTSDGFTKRVRRRAYFYEFPTLTECRQHWDENLGGNGEWPEVQETLPMDDEPERREAEREPF